MTKISGFILYSPLEHESTGTYNSRGQEILNCTKFKYFFRVYNEEGFIDSDLDLETDIEIIDDRTSLYESEMKVDWATSYLGRTPKVDERSAKGARGKLYSGVDKWLFIHDGKTYEWRCEDVEVLKFEESEMKIELTAREILDYGDWDAFCSLRGINEWAINEGLMDADESFSFDVEELSKIGFSVESLSRIRSKSTVKTADDFPLNVGDTVWIRSNVLDPSVDPVEAVVGEIESNKILFDKPDEQGYIGAKLTSVFHERENAYWNLDSLRETGVFSNLELKELITGW